MKPYEVEIFDKHFNFIFNALVDDTNFNYKFDAISAVNNALPITKEFNPLALSDEPSAPRGWYIRVLRDNEEYCGVITAFESGENINTITLSPLTELFDLNIPLPFQSGANVVMETFIKTIIERNFQSSTDSQQNIDNLSCVTTSSTTGTFGFATKANSSGFVSVNVAKDIISEAVAAGIITKVNIDIANKGVNVVIGKDNDSITIEGDLPNIIRPVFNVRKGNNTINRFTAYDTYFTTGYEFYLHPDGSFDSQDRDRILPIYNSISFYNGYEIAKAEVDTRIDEYNAEVQSLISYNGTLSDAQYAELQAVNFGTPPTQDGFSYRIGDYATGYDDDGFYINFKTIFNNAKSGGSYSYSGSVYGSGIDPNYEWYFHFVCPSGYTGRPCDFTVQFSEFAINTNGGEPMKYYRKYAELLPAMVSEWCGPYHESGIAYRRGIVTIPTSTLQPSHLHMDEEYVWKAVISLTIYQSYDDRTVVYSGTTTRQESMDIRTPMYWNDVSSYINSYKGSEAYYNEIKSKAQAASVTEANLLAQTAFSSNKYTNLIEFEVSADDSRIKPLEMEIGQVVDIIHNGVSYNSILTGKEIKNGVVKLIFGTIRLELTKILNMKGI